MAFAGIPLTALDFYEDLEDDNSRTFWLTHKDTYDTAVRRPMELLTAQLDPKFGEVKLFRPYRDVRFAKDKTPYKTQQGAVLGKDPVGALYVHVGAPGLFVGGGVWSLGLPAESLLDHHHPDADQRQHQDRAAKDAFDPPGLGDQVDAAVADEPEVERQGADVNGDDEAGTMHPVRAGR